MTYQYLIRKVGEEEPFGFSGWSESQAAFYAKYNSERWGPHEVVCRDVGDWKVINPE